MAEKLIQIKRGLMWLCIFATSFVFMKIAKDLYETDISKTKYLIAMIYFGWLAVMFK